MISRSMEFFSCNLLMAGREIHKLLVLKILNLVTDLNSSTWALGTCAISSSLRRSSYWIRVPPWTEGKQAAQAEPHFLQPGPDRHEGDTKHTLTSALVLSVTSMMNSQRLSAGWLIRWLRMNRSTVAPRLSMLETKMYSFPSAMSLSRSPEFWKLA